MNHYPSFIIAGSKKAGTTWLYDVLKQHPDVWLPPQKEMLVNFFFDPGDVNKYRRIYYDLIKAGTFATPDEMQNNLQLRAFLNHYFTDLPLDTQWYERCFSDFSQGRVTGDVDPNLYTLPKARIHEVAKSFPELKLMIVLRNPLKRAWSSLKMSVSEAFGEQAQAMSLEELIKIIHNGKLISKSTYSTILPAWREAFGDRLWLYSYDRICNNPAAVVADTLHFIGVKDMPIMLPPSNVGVSWAMPKELAERAPDCYRAELDYIQNLLPNETFER